MADMGNVSAGVDFDEDVTDLPSEPTVTVNGADPGATVTPLAGGGYNVFIPGGDVDCPKGETTGTIVVSAGAVEHCWTIKCS